MRAGTPRQFLQPRKSKTDSTRDGLPLFPRRPGAGPVTLDLVNQLRDAQP